MTPIPAGPRPAFLIGILAATLLGGCVTDGVGPTQLGAGGSMVTGSASAAGNVQGQAAELARCDRPMGSIALVEADQPGLAQYNLQSPVPLLRLMIQQSRCFAVVDRGQATTALMRERELAAAGQLRAAPQLQGQMAMADYLLTPNVIFTSPDAGGAGLNLGALLPGWGGVIGGTLSPSVTSRVAQTFLTLTDVRSGLQLVSAEGSAKTTDLSLAGGVSFAAVGSYDAGLSNYANTPEGKVVTASFVDGFNKLVAQARTLLPAAAPPAAPPPPSKRPGKRPATTP